MITLRPIRRVNDVRRENGYGLQTFRPQCHADSVGKDINTLENASSALVRELDFLVSTTGQSGLRGLGYSAAERPR
jgi:hypothetical protein